MPTTRPTVRALAACGVLLAVTAMPTATDAQAPPAGTPPATTAARTLAPAPAAATPLPPVAARRLVDDLRRSAHRAGARRGPSRRLRLTAGGRAVVPAHAPAAVRRLVRAGNRISHMPYVWGGGHGSWKAPGYDCSGSVGYVLHAAGVLDRSVTSGDLASFGRPGRGRWVTVYAHGGHTYLVVAGLRFDTSAYKASGSRWTPDVRSEGGYAVRHPAGM